MFAFFMISALMLCNGEGKRMLGAWRPALGQAAASKASLEADRFVALTRIAHPILSGLRN